MTMLRAARALRKFLEPRAFYAIPRSQAEEPLKSIYLADMAPDTFQAAYRAICSFTTMPEVIPATSSRHHLFSLLITALLHFIPWEPASSFHGPQCLIGIITSTKWPSFSSRPRLHDAIPYEIAFDYSNINARFPQKHYYWLHAS